MKGVRMDRNEQIRSSFTGLRQARAQLQVVIAISCQNSPHTRVTIYVIFEFAGDSEHDVFFISTPGPNGTDILTIGQRMDSPDSSFQGSVDSIRIMNRALESDEFLHDPPAGWSDIDFDDSAWPSATEYGRNDLGTTHWAQHLAVPSDSSGGHVKPGISDDAQWIWTDDHEQHNDLFCRGDMRT